MPALLVLSAAARRKVSRQQAAPLQLLKQAPARHGGTKNSVVLQREPKYICTGCLFLFFSVFCCCLLWDRGALTPRGSRARQVSAPASQSSGKGFCR